MAKREYAVDSGTEMRELDPQMPTPIGGWRLYNGTDDWFKLQIAGMFYHIPPDRGSTEANKIFVDHPVKDVPGQRGEALAVEANGILVIDDQIGHHYDEKSRRQTGRYQVYNAARDICGFAIKNHGAHGIALLKGTNQDERIKQQARKLFSDAQVEKDSYLVDTYKSNVAAWKRAHPEQLAPPPPEDVRLAQERLDDRQQDRRATHAYMCQDCGTYASNNWEPFARHARINHGKTIKPEDYDSPETEDAPKRRGRPPKVEAASA